MNFGCKVVADNVRTVHLKASLSQVHHNMVGTPEPESNHLGLLLWQEKKAFLE